MKKILNSTVVLIALGWFMPGQLATAQESEQAQTTYKVIDLGVLPGGTQSQALAINNRAQVVGASDSSANAQSQAVLWQQGITYPLGMPGFQSTTAKSINDQGIVAGLGSVSDGPPFRALLWNNGAITDLGDLGGGSSFAAHINNHRQVVGSSRTATHLQHAYVWQDGVMADLGTLPGGVQSIAWSINERGQVTGEASTSGGAVEHAFIWQDGAMQDIGTLGGSESIANSINNRGQIAGEADLAGDNTAHAFLFDNNSGKTIDLGTLPGGSISLAQGINDRGQVVGGSDTADNPEHAFLFDRGQMADLNSLIPADSGWVLSQANAINENGEIAGEGEFTGQTHAFLLLPNREDNRAIGPFSGWSTPVNLGPAVNSAFNDSHPAISRNGLSLYFVSDRPGGLGDFDIWVTQRATIDSGWGVPQNLGPKINSTSIEFSPTFSASGHWLLFASGRPGGCGGEDIWASHREDKDDDFAWEDPINLGCGINSPQPDDGPTYFRDRQTGIATLYFTSFNRPGNIGDWDIYASMQNQDGTFGPGVLVPELSSPFRDTRTAIRHDGLEMFITSNRPGGTGTLNLLVSTRETVLERWSKPVDLGPTVNSTAVNGAPALSYDGTTLYFYSTRPGGSGKNDLWVTTRTKLGDSDGESEAQSGR